MKLQTLLPFITLFGILLSCGSLKENTIKEKKTEMEFTIKEIRNEKDGQTLFLSDNNGALFTTVISIPNGNYIEVEKGDRIQLTAKEILEMDPAIIISENIKIIEGNKNEKPNIQTIISTQKRKFKINEKILLNSKITNFSNSNYVFLPWGTPFEDRYTNDCLTIVHKGKTIPYSGMMVKRIPPKESDYVTVKPNTEFNKTTNILDGYQINQIGTYRVQIKRGGEKIPSSNIIEIELIL